MPNDSKHTQSPAEEHLVLMGLSGYLSPSSSAVAIPCCGFFSLWSGNHVGLFNYGYMAAINGLPIMDKDLYEKVKKWRPVFEV